MKACKLLTYDSLALIVEKEKISLIFVVWLSSCCASCKWQDHGSRCLLYDKNKRKIDLDEERKIDSRIEEIDDDDE